MTQEKLTETHSIDAKAMKRQARELARQQSYPAAIAVWKGIEKAQGIRADTSVAIARLYIKQKDWASALSTAAAALSTNGLRQNLSLLKMQGHSALSLKDYPSAIRAYTAIADTAPDAAVSAIKRLAARKHFEAAAHILAVVLSEHPTHAEALKIKPLIMNALDAQREQPHYGIHEQAGICRLLLVIEPRHHAARQQLRGIRNAALDAAREELKNGDLAAAEQAFNAMLGSNPLDPAALRGLANIDKARRDWNALAGRWNQIAQAENNPERVTLARARALAKAERPLETLEALILLSPEALADEKVQALLSRQVHLTLQQAKLQLADGNIADVLRATRTVRSLQPDNQRAQAFENLALTKGRRILHSYAKAGDHEQVITYAQMLLQSAPNDLSLLRHLCKSYTQQRAYTSGLPWFKRLTELDPDQPSNWLRYAVSCRAARHEDDALAAARQALTLDPKNRAATQLIEAIMHRRIRMQEPIMAMTRRNV